MGLIKNTEIYSSTKLWGSEFLLKNTPLYIVKLIEIAPGKTIPQHAHSEKEETWVVTVGTGSVTIDTAKINVVSGTVIHISPGESHMISAGQYGLTMIVTSTPEMWEN